MKDIIKINSSGRKVYSQNPLETSSGRLEKALNKNEQLNTRLAKQKDGVYTLAQYRKDCKRNGVVTDFAAKAGNRIEIDMFAPGIDGDMITTINRILYRRHNSTTFYIQFKFEMHRVFFVEGMRPYVRLTEFIRIEDIM